jgi:uncharacterized OB-fold protein
MTAPFEPQPTPETAPYWDGAREGRLRIQFCEACARHYFYPRSHCRYCGSPDVRWVDASGGARLESYVINHRPMPGYEAVVALVQLDEGPRMMTNIVDVAPDPANLPLDLRLRVTFRPRGAMTLPCSAPEVRTP